MTEKAYSYQLKKQISAYEIDRYKQSGDINDPRAFRCPDKKCGVALTVYDWNGEKPEKKYFTISHKSPEGQHVNGCNFVDRKEAKKAVEQEIRSIIEDCGDEFSLITRRVTATTSNNVKPPKPNDVESPFDDIHTGKNISGKNKNTPRLSSLATYVGIYKNPKFSNSKLRNVNLEFIEREDSAALKNIHGKFSLNQIFHSVNNVPFVQLGELRIFSGNILIKNPDWDKENKYAEIIFVANQKLFVRTTIEKLEEILSANVVQEYLNKEDGEISNFYFQGAFVREKESYKGYPMYQDVYQSIYFDGVV